MKKFINMLVPVFFILFLFSCSGKVLPPPQWTYEKDAIKLQVIADPMLNLDEGKAHTLHVCIYQLKDPNGFNQLASDQSGLYKLLDCKLFDQGVAASKRLIVHPGEETKWVLDRAENAKYLAVVAGYYGIVKERITRLIEVPVIIEVKGFFTKKRKQIPGLLDVKLLLGPQQIKKLEGQL
ncbi:MAG: type VI secretion system lipoprotein TssJ [Desulfobacula sp.]|uniref:type VI secretion system lipoprotein TssJ n=1 Tax=Desulfobacula sp. TaxID=2593537 RepID=UPI0025BF0EB4|nr:type VI secretion system lipoprotein TssJ [Desulfobacula sp.]MCD4721633.1 type VI secretion system lipoprotein TssJ [Desulfobacula sp.]